MEFCYFILLTSKLMWFCNGNQVNLQGNRFNYIWFPLHTQLLPSCCKCIIICRRWYTPFWVLRQRNNQGYEMLIFLPSVLCLSEIHQRLFVRQCRLLVLETYCNRKKIIKCIIKMWPFYIKYRQSGHFL